MKDTGRMINFMEKEATNMKMEELMKENGKMVRLMDMEYISILWVGSMKVNGIKTHKLGKVMKYIQMGLLMMVILKMGSNMEREL